MTTIKDLEKLRKEIEKEIDNLYEISTVINSLKSIFNFFKTGKTHPEIKMI